MRKLFFFKFKNNEEKSVYYLLMRRGTRDEKVDETAAKSATP